MIAGIEQADDHAVDRQRSWNPDGLAECPGHALGNARFAIATVAIQKEAVSGVNRLTDLVEHLIVEHQVVKHPGNIVEGWRAAVDRLGAHAVDIILQDHRRRAIVGAVAGIARGRLDARFRQLIDVVVERSASLVHDHAVRLQLIEHRGKQSEGDRDLLGDLAARGRHQVEQALERQFLGPLGSELHIRPARRGQWPEFVGRGGSIRVFDRGVRPVDFRAARRLIGPYCAVLPRSRRRRFLNHVGNRAVNPRQQTLQVFVVDLRHCVSLQRCRRKTSAPIRFEPQKSSRDKSRSPIGGKHQVVALDDRPISSRQTVALTKRNW